MYASAVELFLASVTSARTAGNSAVQANRPRTRGLHSSTSQLNLNNFT